MALLLAMFCYDSVVVTVEFSSEKDQEMALRRNKNYIGEKIYYTNCTSLSCSCNCTEALELIQGYIVVPLSVRLES